MAAFRVRQIALVAVTLGVIGLACSSDKGDDDDDGTTSTPTPSPVPVFSGIVVPMFYAECGATRTDCHSRETFVADTAMGCNGFLALEDTALGSVYYSGSSAGLPTGCPDRSLYDRLLMSAAQCDAAQQEWVRPHITPGVYSSSYLFQKIAGGPFCLLADSSMSATMPLDHAISGEDIDAIRDWINDGALPSD